MRIIAVLKSFFRLFIERRGRGVKLAVPRIPPLQGVHNHPSGDPEPSPEDIKMTLDLQKAGAIFSVILHDHIIIGDGRYVSFRERGLLK